MIKEGKSFLFSISVLFVIFCLSAAISLQIGSKGVQAILPDTSTCACGDSGYPVFCGEIACRDATGLHFQIDSSDTCQGSCIPCSISCASPSHICSNGKCVDASSCTYSGVCSNCQIWNSCTGKCDPDPACPPAMACICNADRAGMTCNDGKSYACSDPGYTYCTQNGNIAECGAPPTPPETEPPCTGTCPVAGQPIPPAPASAPPAPTGLAEQLACEPNPDPGDSSPITVTFSWNPSPGADHYKVAVWKNTVPMDWWFSGSLTATSDTWHDFPLGTHHWWVVIAYGDAAETEAYKSISTPQKEFDSCVASDARCPCSAQVPIPPASYSCEKIINWAPYSGSDFLQYAIQYSIDPTYPAMSTSTTPSITPASQTTYTLTNVASNQQYYYRVLVGVSTTSKPGWWCIGGGCLAVQDSGTFTIPDAQCKLPEGEPVYKMCVCKNHIADVLLQQDSQGATRWVYGEPVDDTEKCGDCFYNSNCPSAGDSA